ncbi:MAG TPA: sulfurtransferase TusA family protein [Deltaproteobacteria bacterium]|nr:MAG: tRNA methyltransferase [Deltaproteobacteria bacterium GWA2_55_82]OGQ63393.1 MAG: tRNA methyltransferase [Deltaproteobacteria bacterium RIFCSPLOWO2_02_FULL_55_12]OIJ73193.1 MAG: tRNA methyltransferase [Deltaproteobacteria bacterium GWC2_55_46]HBG45550.1 sulfurtransferase TusA family protein [Deltaproteobacteria bacterium]HCY10381.1 sulfurtransferase TusA family protein [Deltaproteobacteria bacterium]
MSDTDIKTQATLDLRGVLCPINFVKTKLKLETMSPGEVLEVILDSGDPIQNVPKSIKDEGHKIVEVKREGDSFRLKVQRGS